MWYLPVPVAARSKAARLLKLWVRIPPEALMSVVSVVCCQRSLRRTDHSSRGVLPTVARRCVWSRNLVNEEALAHWGLSRQKKEKMKNVLRGYEEWFGKTVLCEGSHLLGYDIRYVATLLPAVWWSLLPHLQCPASPIRICCSSLPPVNFELVFHCCFLSQYHPQHHYVICFKLWLLQLRNQP